MVHRAATFHFYCPVAFGSRLPPSGSFATLRAMPVSWKEIRHNAIEFSRELDGREKRERGKADFLE
jgi:hypothetical protein